MISNPNPEHGPLWVERNPAWPHDGPAAFLCWLGYRLWLDAEQADAIEAQITQLPDGVYRCKDGGHAIAAGHQVPVGWERPQIPGSASWSRSSRIRRIPAEPPAPPTEDVPLHELCGRKLPVALWVVQSVRIAGRHIYAFDTLNPFEATISHPVTLNPDGTVTVQRETAPDGTS